jgi:predicted SnoaL-like aldol condensation-catalyzing enzyme
MEKLKSRILYFSIILMSGFSLASCSKKVVYTSPVALSEDYISNLSKEKQMAFDFVTAAKNNVKLSSLTFAENFYSLDQQWNGNKTDYIQKRNAANFSTIKPIRIIQDDSLVAVHSRMLGDTLKFRWDILQIENQQIMAHWSNVNDSIGLSPDKHSEIDGPTIPEQLEKTDTNRAHIKRFMDQCMIREDGGAPQFFNFGLYIQHNRHVGDGLNGLLWAMVKMSLQGNKIKFAHNYHVMVEGNLVLSATEGFVGDRKTVFYDFFRVEDSKIVEHWDIITPVNEFHYFQME